MIPHRWLAEDDGAGKHDFEISGIKIGAKTAKRRVLMKPDYTAQITARRANEPILQFFFMGFEFPRNVVWLLGGIATEGFLRDAIYYGADQRAHSKYVCGRP